MTAHPTILATTPRARPSGGHPLDPGQDVDATHTAPAGVDLPADNQRHSDTHGRPVVGTLASTTDQSSTDTHSTGVGGAASSSQPSRASASTHGSRDGWLELRIWAEMFDDAQKARIAATNRAERGGVDPDIYDAYLESLRRAEHECGLAMRRCLRRVAPSSVIAWQKASGGIGEHLLARLLGHLGHPVRATPHHWDGTGASRVLVTDPPIERTVGQLWQFCGHGAPTRRTKGMSATDLAAQGNPTLKMVVHLLAEACMKVRTSPYRLVYERTRLAVADKTHIAECVRCGPSGKPAQVGSPWSAGHQHAHALRIVGKELLRDLWIVSGGAGQ